MDEKLIQSAADKLVIQDVFVLDNVCKRDKNFLPPYTTFDRENLRTQNKHFPSEYHIVTGELDDEVIEHVVFRYRAGFRLVENPDDDDETVLFVCETDFAAVYLINGEVDDDELQEFGSYNVGYHVWPYWREHCSAVTSKFKLPVKIKIPFYRHPKHEKKPQ